MKNELVTKFEKNINAMAKLNREIEKAVGTQMKKLETLREQDAKMRESILAAMEANDVSKFDGDLITITYVKPSVRNTFDSKTFIEENPKRAEKYMRKTQVKASIRLKVKA